MIKKYRYALLLLLGIILFNSCKSANTPLSGNQITEINNITTEEIAVSEFEKHLVTDKEGDSDIIPLQDYPLYFNYSIPGDNNRHAIHVEIQLPQWIEYGNGIYEKMNKFYQIQFEELCQLASEKIDFYNSVSSINSNHDYIFTYICENSSYINNQYLQLVITSNNKGWGESDYFPGYQIWDVKAGELLSIEDLFAVETEVYLARLQTIAENQELNYSIHEVISNLSCFYLESYSNKIVFELPQGHFGQYTGECFYLRVASDTIEDILSENFLDNSFRNLESELIYNSLKQEISKFPELIETSTDFPGDNTYQYYTGQLGMLPDGYSHHIAVLDYTQKTDVRLYLFAINKSATDAKLLDYLDFNGYYNSAKADLLMNTGEIDLWSQFPFKAAESHASFIWNGISLKLNELTYSDSSQEVLNQQKTLLEKKDIDGLMELDNVIFYPLAYPDYLILPKPILLFAHEEALTAYHSGNLARAIQIIEYGLENYLFSHYAGSLSMYSGLQENNFEEQSEDLLTKEEYALIINNYAFFLYESGNYEQALIFLHNTVLLNPDRIVAHLNLGDTYWALGETEHAVEHYKRYDELIINKDIIPDYVKQRLVTVED